MKPPEIRHACVLSTVHRLTDEIDVVVRILRRVPFHLFEQLAQALLCFASVQVDQADRVLIIQRENMAGRRIVAANEMKSVRIVLRDDGELSLMHVNCSRHLLGRLFVFVRLCEGLRSANQVGMLREMLQSTLLRVRLPVDDKDHLKNEKFQCRFRKRRTHLSLVLPLIKSDAPQDEWGAHTHEDKEKNVQ